MPASSTGPASPDFEVMGARALRLSQGEGRRLAPPEDPAPERPRRPPKGGRGEYPELPWLLRYFRERIAIGRSELASRCGCHANSVSAWEQAKWVPSERMVGPLCRALRLSRPEATAFRSAAGRDRRHVASLNLSGMARRGVRRKEEPPGGSRAYWRRRASTRARVERFRDRDRLGRLGPASREYLESLVSDAEDGIWRKEFDGRSGRALMAALARNGRSILLERRDTDGDGDEGAAGHPGQDGVGGA